MTAEQLTRETAGQLTQVAANLRVEHARRMAWCEANPHEAASRYGLDVFEQAPGAALELTPFERAVDPRRTWARAIAAELCGDQWEWSIHETAGSGPVFTITNYRGRAEA